MVRKTTTRSIKVLVPKGTDRDSLVVFAQRTIKQMLHLNTIKIVSITPSHSKAEKDGELTYRVTFINLMPN